MRFMFRLLGAIARRAPIAILSFAITFVVFWSGQSVVRYLLQLASQCESSRSVAHRIAVSAEDGVSSVRHLQPVKQQAEIARESYGQQLVFAGVMTAQKYVDNRAVSVYRTWGKNLPSIGGRMVLFSSASSNISHPELPVVYLPGVDDSYPPQKKSFLMIKYMYDHFLEQYEWFMRADDDVYVHVNRLQTFLASLNSSKPFFIGQAGMGNKEEFGMLSLAPGENFCMGGPGIVLSRETLRLMGPNVQYCLKNLMSTHEDVELGRCIRKFAGISCAWSYEMQTIFYHNQSGAAAFTGDLNVKEVLGAITLHPVKTSQHLHRIQNFYTANDISVLHQEILHLQREIHDMNDLLSQKAHSDLLSGLSPHAPSLNRYQPRSFDEVLEWDFFTKSYYSHLDYNPKRGLRGSLKWALNDLIMQLMGLINLYSKQRGRVISYKDLLYGYQRLDPLYGVQYVLDLHLVYKRYSGRKMTAPVRRHAYLEQAFSRIELIEEMDCVGEAPSPYDFKRDFTSILRYYSGKAPSNASVVGSQVGDTCVRRVDKEVVNIILPLAGRLPSLMRFMDMLEKDILSSEDAISLLVVNFPDAEKDSEIQIFMKEKQERNAKFRVGILNVNGTFSRALALQKGAGIYPSDALLFLVDVDMAFDMEFLERVRGNTRLRKMAYYPVVFSQYKPDEEQMNAGVSPFVLNEDNGYWRQFGYGIVSCYRLDLDRAGGFNLNIHGWGKEDVDLFEKFIQLSQKDPQFEVFRAADPGLVHIYHEIHCDPGLEPAQLNMCLGSQKSSIAGQRKLSRMVLSLLTSNASSESHIER